MSTRPDVRQLLTGALPLERVGPALRRAARQAVAAGDAARLSRVARTVVAELVRRGDLVRVAVESGRPCAHLYVVRGDTRLLDLSALASTGAGPGPTARAPEPPAPPAAAAPLPDDEALARLLRALEHDRGLPLGEPRAAHRQVVLEGILDLLARAAPQLQFAVLLTGEADPEVPARRVVSEDELHPVPFWGRHRPAGGAVWFDAATALPTALRRALGAPDDDTPFVAAGVPLASPPDPGTGESAAEAGLLLVATQAPVARAGLLARARQMARFVAARWRQHLALTLLVHGDSLTGVHNRAYFDGHLVMEIERARRHESPLSLIMADIDHFKRINDAWGHPAGDQVLRTVARELQGGLRRIDMVCRIGGEEFALILPDTPAGAAQEVCARLIERFDRLRMNVPGVPEPLRVTLSFGGVTFPEGGTDPAELYRKADGMLYLSKRQGRNRCTFWQPQGEPTVIAPPVP